jgi:hypothetical protein
MRDQDLALAAEDLNVIADILDLANKILMSARNILISLAGSVLSSDKIPISAPTFWSLSVRAYSLQTRSLSDGSRLGSCLESSRCPRSTF